MSPLVLDTEEGESLELFLGVDEMDILFVGDCAPFTFFRTCSSGVFPFIICLTGIFDWSTDRAENLSDNEDNEFLRLIGKLVGFGLLTGV